MPKVSIIMPTYNNEKYIGEAIESVLNQTYQDFELIIVDDGNTDQTYSIALNFEINNKDKVKIIRHERNLGVSFAKNTGIKASTGRYIMFAASDDIQSPNRLEIMVHEIESKKVDMLFADCEMIDENGVSLNRTKGYPDGINEKNALLYNLDRNYLWSGLVLMKNTKDVYFDTTIPNAVDFDLFLRLLLKGFSIAFMDDVVLKYRSHSTNISGKAYIARNSIKRILGKWDLDQVKQLLLRDFSLEKVNRVLASVALWKDEPQKAVDYLTEKAVDDFEYQFLLGVSYYRLNNYKESFVVFKKLNTGYPESEEVWNNLGVLHFYYGKNNFEVKRCFKEALKLNEAYMDVQHNLKQLECNKDILRITERPLRKSLLHVQHYKFM